MVVEWSGSQAAELHLMCSQQAHHWWSGTSWGARNDHGSEMGCALGRTCIRHISSIGHTPCHGLRAQAGPGVQKRILHDQRLWPGRRQRPGAEGQAPWEVPLLESLRVPATTRLRFRRPQGHLIYLSPCLPAPRCRASLRALLLQSEVAWDHILCAPLPHETSSCVHSRFRRLSCCGLLRSPMTAPSQDSSPQPSSHSNPPEHEHFILEETLKLNAERVY